MLTGIGASAGIGIGKALVIHEETLAFIPHAVEDREAELQRWRTALETFCDRTTAQADELRARVGEQDAAILEGHILMIRDPFMTGEIERQITEEGACAENALSMVCDQFAAIFSATDDELTRQRVTDVEDIKTGILRLLLGVSETDLSAIPPDTVVVTRELTPSMTARIRTEHVAAFVTETGGKTAHAAILARSLEIPAVLGIPDATSRLQDGDIIVVDGGTGEVLERPSAEQLADYRARQQALLEDRRALLQYIGKPTETADGRQLELVANIGTPEEASRVLECDGEGVGLFRTEFLFMDRDALPTEEEQFAAYRQAVLTLKGRPLIIRTLDVGGDKALPYLGMQPEENPFLGYRAVRFCLGRPDIFRPQLRALLRASAFGDIRIMVPLVTCVEELTAVRTLLAELMKDLDGEHISYNRDIPVGIMIETPAAGAIADLLAAEADFFSIGTNDLTQYFMAVDRGNSQVSYLYSPFQPAVLRAIRHIIDCGRRAGIPVGMCGEAASDPLLIPLLLSFGLTEFSVNPTSLLATRREIARWTLPEAGRLTAEIMRQTTEAAVRRLLEAQH